MKASVCVISIVCSTATSAAPAAPPGGSAAPASTVTVNTPFPKFAPQASATTIYCEAVATAGLHGSVGAPDDKVPDGISASAGLETDRSRQPLLRIRFEATRIMVASSMRNFNAGVPIAEWPYRILRDDPTNFFATDERNGASGFLQAIALNRVTGTLVESAMYASIPEGAHPSGTTSFYVCQSKPFP